MLFVLNRAEHFPSSAIPEDGHLLEFIEALGGALSERRHAVHAPPALLDEWAEIRDLSRRQRAVLSEAARHLRGLTYPRVQPELLSDAVVVTGPNGEHPLPDTWRGPPPIRLPMNDATRLLGQRTLLGAENSADAEWFGLLGRAWALYHRQDSQLAVETRGLGGGAAADETKSSLRQDRITLVILDSDRDHADASLGSTAAKVLKEVRETLEPNTPRWIEVLQAREVENLLPQALVERLKGREWVVPMSQRGVFLRPDRPPSPALFWLDLGKDWCATALQHQGEGPAREARRAALEHMAMLDPDCIREPCSYDSVRGFGCATEKEPHKPRCDAKRQLVVHAVGKPLRAILNELDLLRDEAVNALLDALPKPGSDSSKPLWDPARRVWSWGLAFKPRLPPAAS